MILLTTRNGLKTVVNINLYVFLSVTTQYKTLLWLVWLFGPDSISIVLIRFHDFSTPNVTFYSTVNEKRVTGICSGWHSYWALIICQALCFRKIIPFPHSIYLHAVEGHGFCNLWSNWQAFAAKVNISRLVDR